MSIIKKSKDHLIKLLLGDEGVPRGLFELNQYFRHNDPINFKYEKSNDSIMAISTNFRYGSIVTSASNMKELDSNIKDAILTEFEIPSSYSNEAKILKVGNAEKKYAIA